MNNEFILKLKLDYDNELVEELLKRYKNKPYQLKNDFYYIRQELYTKTKLMFLPDWIRELEYKDNLIRAHDIIIEECLGYAAYKLNDKLLYKLNKNFLNKIPFYIQVRFFQNLKLTQPVKLDDLLTCFGYGFTESCREIYKKSLEFEKKWHSGKIKIGKELKSIK